MEKSSSFKVADILFFLLIFSTAGWSPHATCWKIIFTSSAVKFKTFLSGKWRFPGEKLTHGEQLWAQPGLIFLPSCRDQTWRQLLDLSKPKDNFKRVFLFSIVYFFWQVHQAFLYYSRRDVLISGNNECFIWNVWIPAACRRCCFSNRFEGRRGGQLGSSWQSFISWHPFLCQRRWSCCDKWLSLLSLATKEIQLTCLLDKRWRGGSSGDGRPGQGWGGWSQRGNHAQVG